MGVREEARDMYLRLTAETTTTGSVGAGVVTALGQVPSTNKKKGRCPKCKDMFSPRCKCPNVKTEGWTADGYVDDDAVGDKLDPAAGEKEQTFPESFWRALASFFSKTHQSDLGLYADRAATLEGEAHADGCLAEIAELLGTDMPEPHKLRLIMLRGRIEDQRSKIQKEA